MGINQIKKPMKKIYFLAFFIGSIIITSAHEISEGFEVGDQDPFTGNAELTWTGDVSWFEIANSNWPSNSEVEFAGLNAIRSKGETAVNSTIITSLSGIFNANYKCRWEVYISGNVADITNSKGFSLILFVDSDNIADIESGSVNGYRLRVTDPDGGDSDGVYLEKASGSGWVKIDQHDTLGLNVNMGWNLAVERESDGTWNWGFENGSISSNISLFETVVDNDHTSGPYSGINWFSSKSDARDFGFDEFSVDSYVPGLWDEDAASTVWNDASNWDTGTLPGNSTDVIIPGNATNFPTISTANATCNNLNIAPGAQLTLDNSYSLTLAGDLTVESTSAGTGSLLSTGTLSVSGSEIFQRYIEAYTGPANGWHLISSPVDAFAVTGSDFEPGVDDDLYRWDEPDYIWENWKVDNFNFANGMGYLVAYATSASREFIGTFNNANITFEDLTVTADFGWHLLGNPFPCALIWGDGNWSLTNIEGVAKVYDESAGNYIDVNANEIIPASQGFFVGTDDASNSITIPKVSRTHDATPFYKGTANDVYLSLKVSGGQNDFYDINRLAFNPDATVGYDREYDGHKMPGQEEAPQMYMYCEPDDWLSTNTLPD